MSDSIPSEEEQRRHWRLLWLSSIQAFSDRETQTSRWLDPNERNPHYSFVECMCAYFDDAYLREENGYERRLERGHLTKTEFEAVAQFHSKADAYKSPGGDDYDTSSILQDSNWQAVVDAAQSAQQRLLPLLTDPLERDALTRPLVWRQASQSFHADLVGSSIVPAGQWVAENRSGGWLQRLLGKIRG